MLYEMITGGPPFVRDNPTAVIGQQINTPPVAPSWLSGACPQDLQELVLRLLAKDPGERPASADEALAVLERVDPAQKSASHSGSNVLDRLALAVFVGREQEMERRRKACDNAAAGHGGLVMLVGEPGIGKTLRRSHCVGAGPGSARFLNGRRSAAKARSMRQPPPAVHRLLCSDRSRLLNRNPRCARHHSR